MNDIMARIILFQVNLMAQYRLLCCPKGFAQSDPVLFIFPRVIILFPGRFYKYRKRPYYKYINENGEMIEPGQCLCNASKSQYQPLTAILNNKAYTVWADGRSSGKQKFWGFILKIG